MWLDNKRMWNFIFGFGRMVCVKKNFMTLGGLQTIQGYNPYIEGCYYG